MIDEYTLFYFNWIEPIKDSLLEKGMRPGYWERIQHSQAWHTWIGYAFESICYKHLPQISVALKLSPIAVPYTWRYSPLKGTKEQGAQIDLLFDRDDNAISLCKIKFTEQPFIIDKSYAKKLEKIAEIFKKITQTSKHIFLEIISANGFKKISILMK